MKNALLALGLATTLLTGCGKDDSADLPPPQPAAKVSVDAGPAVAAAPTAPVPAPVGNPVVASTGNSSIPDWKPGDGEPAAGKFPPAVKRDFGTDGNPNMDNLTLAMRDWSYFTDRFPNDLNELVSTRYLPSIPTPPEGKKYVINAKAASVDLANK